MSLQVRDETHQERLIRLESDRESLVLQVSVLTDQVEVQGEKIRDLESSLEEHHQKLHSTEEMLQQEMHGRASLETQKLDLMGEVSYLKLKLKGFEEEQNEMYSNQHKAEVLLQQIQLLKDKVDDLESQKSQYERKLKATKVKCEIFVGSIQPPTCGYVYFSIYTHGSHREGRPFVFGSWVLHKSPSPRGPAQRPEAILGEVSGSSDWLSRDLGCVDQMFNLLFPCRIRRTQSGRLPVEELETGEFHRGGLRSIPGPRLVGSTSTVVSCPDANIPFSLWSPDQVYDWLEELGLDQLGTSARQWIRSGQMLLDATPHDLEKEMGLKHPLHRKKLQLALLSLSSVQTEKSSQLGHTWVTRWLDDIGLPQYKDQFGEARVDGRMLQYLTVNDLLLLKVTSQLHHVSIRCAIHVLHIHGFDPHYLRRRPGDENETSPGEVLRWSNHRVMEWLRSVDLAEFAPNLRGSGVHGGLIMLEPRFNADTLASLLNIPPLKTLLRRHLGTSFCALIGPLAQREKQDFLEGPGHTPLNSTAKVRPRKLGFSNFGHLRKKRVVECPEYICPMESTPSAVNGGPKGQYPLLDTVAGTLEQVGAAQVTPIIVNFPCGPQSSQSHQLSWL
uniref:PPFIA binding protein 2a n=1 Tax=Scleropages formosus TaxID=113540 RepID=A0A8C9QV31_SCLFO